MSNLRIQNLEIIQKKAVNRMYQNNWIGTLEMATGVGKTFTAFKVLYKASKQISIKTVSFYAETSTREFTLKEEAEKFNRIYDLNPLEDFDFTFKCYQGKNTDECDAAIFDEIHETLTEKYQVCLNIIAKVKVGLSATIPQNLPVYRDVDNSITKGELLQQLCPIVFSYPLDQAIKDGILSRFETTIHKHKLDYVDRCIPANKAGTWKTTEANYYSWRQIEIKKPGTRTFMKGVLAKQCCKLLYNLPSKVKIVKDYLKDNKKTIIFGVELAILEKITDNVVKGGVKDEANEVLITKFNNSDITNIASCKKLKQGITLNGVERCIIVAYYSKSQHMIQQLGRIVRWAEGKIGELIIIVTEDTYEEKWIQELQKVKDKNGNIIKIINLNVKQ